VSSNSFYMITSC